MELADKWEAAQLSYKGKVNTFARNSFRQIPGYTVEDVEQELLVVLYECVIHYDPNRGASFNTYFQGSAKNRIISLIRHFNTKSRKAIVTSLDVDAVAAAVDAHVSVTSAEDRAMRIMELQEVVRDNGTQILYRSGRGRKQSRERISA